MVFDGIGIQCVKKREVDTEMQKREAMHVHPNEPGFSELNRLNGELNSLRLCFQVFIKTGSSNEFNCVLPSVVTNPINDKKSASGLNISDLSRNSCTVAGKEKLMLLCDRVLCNCVQVTVTMSYLK